jgi:DNA-directed RNA polymerase subunit M/transcription elongation factor TFIIS
MSQLNDIRKLAINKIINELKKYAVNNTVNDLEKTAQIIEKNIYRHNSNRYIQNIRSFLINIAQKSVKNTYAKELIDKKTPLKYGYDMNPDRWSTIKEKYDKRQEVSSKDNTFYSTTIQCIKCKKYTVTFMTKQTNAADEAESIIYKCGSCQISWKK